MRLALVAALALAAPVHAQTPAAPPATAPDPARLAAAEKAVAALVPQGVYMAMMRDKMPQMMDMMMGQVMAKSAADLGLPDDGKVPAGQTLGAAAASKDPHFQERMKITTTVMFQEMGVLFDRMEPSLRAGLSRAFARKFTKAQLDDFNAFFATPSGAAFAREYLTTFVDPELMQEMVKLTPEMMKAMPQIMAKAQAATAHLPPPPAPETKDAD